VYSAAGAVLDRGGSASEMVDAAVEMLVEIGEALKGDKAG
jgi:hypothetical protein